MNKEKNQNNIDAGEEKRVEKKKAPKLAKETRKRFLKKGSYSFALCVIVTAVVVALNLMMGQLPASVNEIDISEQKLYSLSEQTLNVLKELDKDVTIYHIASKGSEDDILKKMLAQYEAHSTHIKVELKQPNLNPQFTSQYTDDVVSENSLIVVCGDKNRIINYSDMYESSYSATTYQEQITGFDGEGQITSALNMLTSENLPVMYTLQGHDELDLSSGLKTMIEKENISVQELSLLTMDAVPEDCHILLILSPRVDLSSEDAEKIRAYMKAGGKAVVATYFTMEDMPNLDSVMADYGVGISEGVILEGDSSSYAYQNPMYVVPSIADTAYTSDLADSNYFVLTPIIQAVQTLMDADDSVKIMPLLTSSAQSFEKKNPESAETLEREDGDELGPYSLAVAVEKTEEEIVSGMVVIGSESVFDEGVDSVVSGANYMFLMNIFSQLADHETTSAIASKSLSYDSLNITTGQVVFWRNITMFVLPVVLLMIGGIIWFGRRRR
ncbi:MAG: Gldg family protein [Lachnospiraceae bacterium]|nr:Gldg family protein [Lachnospiraceae bacterium]